LLEVEKELRSDMAWQRDKLEKESKRVEEAKK